MKRFKSIVNLPRLGLRQVWAVSLTLLLASGCALSSDTLRLETEIDALRQQQGQILDQLGELEETRARVTALTRVVDELRLSRMNQPLPDTGEILELLAQERQRTEQRLTLVQHMVALLESRIATFEAPAPLPAVTVATAPAVPAKTAPAKATPVEPTPAPIIHSTAPVPAAPVIVQTTPAKERLPIVTTTVKPTPAATATPAASPDQHVVAAGDTLGTIASIYLGDPNLWQSVWHANPWLTDPSQLEIGMRVTIPENGHGTIQHTVAAGDTLGTIAEHYLGTSARWKQVWRANPWMDNPDRVSPGLIIAVPIGHDTPVVWAPLTVTAPVVVTAPPTPPVTPSPPTPKVAPILVTPTVTTAPVVDKTTPPTETTAKVAVADAPEAGIVRHTVAPGDTMGTIATQYLGDPELWEWIWEANPHLENPDQLRLGMVLLVPVIETDPLALEDVQLAPAQPEASPQPVAPPPPAPSADAAPITHVVTANDTLGTIAAQYLGSSALWQQVWQANPQLDDPNRLRAGDRLHIPSLTTSQHTVAAGETLGTIAELYFGNSRYWDAVWQANPQMGSPNQLHPGQRLTIPTTVPLAE